LAYIPTIELFDAVPVAVPLLAENNFEINTDDVGKLIDKKKTKAIIINTPANPTGNVIKRKTLEELADLAVEYDMYIFSDEAYEKIIYDNANHVSVGSLNGIQDYVVSFFTFSKSYAMCGYRLGYCVAPKRVADAITKIHVYSSISAPTISQMLGVKALAIGNKYTNFMVKEYRRRRDFIVKRLNEIGLGTIKPQGAFYAFSNISAYMRDSRRFAFDLLAKAHVAVVPGAEFGRYGEGYIRCSYATRLPLIEKAMKRIESVLRRYK
jgi:aminotransferase